MFDLPALDAASRVVHATMPPTPQYASPLLASRVGAEVWVKHENHTPTGAFKVRGGLVYCDRLAREWPDIVGLVSATRGNHGQSLAFAGKRAGVPVVIVVPHGNSAEKADRGHPVRRQYRPRAGRAAAGRGGGGAMTRMSCRSALDSPSPRPSPKGRGSREPSLFGRGPGEGGLASASRRRPA